MTLSWAVTLRYLMRFQLIWYLILILILIFSPHIAFEYYCIWVSTTPYWCSMMRTKIEFDLAFWSITELIATDLLNGVCRALPFLLLLSMLIFFHSISLFHPLLTILFDSIWFLFITCLTLPHLPTVLHHIIILFPVQILHFLSLDFPCFRFFIFFLTDISSRIETNGNR